MRDQPPKGSLSFFEWLRLSADGFIILAMVAFPSLAVYRLLRARFTIPLP